MDNIKLIYDRNAKISVSPEGVITRIPGWGNSTFVEYLDPTKAGSFGFYFKYIADFLVNDIGYIRGQTLFGAPYDYRKAPSNFILFKNT